MRVMVLVKATGDSENGLFPLDEMQEMLVAMGKFYAARSLQIF